MILPVPQVDPTTNGSRRLPERSRARQTMAKESLHIFLKLAQGCKPVGTRLARPRRGQRNGPDKLFY